MEARTLAGKWRAHGQAGASNAIKPATVNRELDVFKSVLSKAVEWGKLLDSPARRVKRLRVDNRSTRVLSADEEQRLMAARHGKFRPLVTLALLTGARRGELLNLQWEHVSDVEIVFLETKNGRQRRLPLTLAIVEVLSQLPRLRPWVFTNPGTAKPYTSVAKEPRASPGARHHHNRRRHVPHPPSRSAQPNDRGRPQITR